MPITGHLPNPGTLTGVFTNTAMRNEQGYKVQFRSNNNILQYKYEDETEWKDLIDLTTTNDYEYLSNLPTINSSTIIGEVNTKFLTPPDVVTNMELANLLNNT